MVRAVQTLDVSEGLGFSAALIKAKASDEGKPGAAHSRGAGHCPGAGSLLAPRPAAQRLRLRTATSDRN